MRSFLINNRLAERDPAPFMVKSLRVEFVHNGKLQTVEVSEGGTMVLPTQARLISARYGNLQADAAQKENGDVFHYALLRQSKDSPWKLRRAWRTDTNDHLLEEYPIP